MTESSSGHKHSCFKRLSFVRSFAIHMSSLDGRTEIPPAGTVRRPEIALRPYIYTRDEIARLMATARNLFSPQKLRCHTYYHLVGLLATTGMRSGEAVRLASRDVNLADGLITIRESKFGKSRVVPLHPTTVESLIRYKARRDAFLKKAEVPTFFINERRGAISSPHKSFRDIRCAAGLEEVWEFRYYEPDAQGERQRRAVMVGTREEYPTESAARKAPVVQAILLRLNAEQPAAPGTTNFGAVIARYEQEEMPERYSTRAVYQ